MKEHMTLGKKMTEDCLWINLNKIDKKSQKNPIKEIKKI